MLVLGVCLVSQQRASWHGHRNSTFTHWAYSSYLHMLPPTQPMLRTVRQCESERAVIPSFLLASLHFVSDSRLQEPIGRKGGICLRCIRTAKSAHILHFHFNHNRRDPRLQFFRNSWDRSGRSVCSKGGQAAPNRAAKKEE
jgi:hypothetical protein